MSFGVSPTMMRKVSIRIPPGQLEIALFGLACAWYLSIYKFLTAGGKGGLDVIAIHWLFMMAFIPFLTGVLSLALDAELKRRNRPLAFAEIALVVFVAPQALMLVSVVLLIAMSFAGAR